jgi:hypothetical protein
MKAACGASKLDCKLHKGWLVVSMAAELLFIGKRHGSYQVVDSYTHLADCTQGLINPQLGFFSTPTKTTLLKLSYQDSSSVQVLPLDAFPHHGHVAGIFLAADRQGVLVDCDGSVYRLAEMSIERKVGLLLGCLAI